jgi:pimeloyl-ACP methyl ester carboxylesterase
MIKGSFMLASELPRVSTVLCASPAGLHRVGYQEWGDPDNPRVVVCVHGLTRLGDDFRELALALKKDFRVVAPDIVGRGRSSWLKDPMLYGVPQYVGDMVSLIARLNVAQVDWVGTSMGGLIGMTLAALEHSPIRRLVLNDVGALLSGEALGRIASYVGQHIEFESRQAAHQRCRQVYSGFGPHTDEQWSRIIDAALVPVPNSHRVRMHYDPDIAAPFRQAYGANTSGTTPPADLSLWHLYDAIRAPTMVMRGELSDLLTADVHAEMGRRGPKATTVEIAGVGHAPTLMHDDQIALVTDFLNEPTVT